MLYTYDVISPIRPPNFDKLDHGRLEQTFWAARGKDNCETGVKPKLWVSKSRSSQKQFLRRKKEKAERAKHVLNLSIWRGVCIQRLLLCKLSRHANTKLKI